MSKLRRAIEGNIPLRTMESENQRISVRKMKLTFSSSIAGLRGMQK